MKRGKPVAMSYRTPEATQYKKSFAEYVRSEVLKQNWDLIPTKSQHFYVDAVFYFDKKNKDANNYWKILLDAITDTQLVWIDDNVVCERVQRIYYDTDNPRIELHIYPVDYIGVFDNSPQMEAFVSRCIGCTRYARNCSVLRQAIEGRIQDEIKDCVCSNFKARKE